MLPLAVFNLVLLGTSSVLFLLFLEFEKTPALVDGMLSDSICKINSILLSLDCLLSFSLIDGITIGLLTT